MSRTATPRDLIPEAHTALGTLLRPFSLGHHLLLAKIESPFFSQPAAAAEPEDLALAIFICASRYADTEAAMLRGEWDSEFARWSKRLRVSRLQRTPFNQVAEAAKFSAYLADGYRRAPVCRHLTGAAIKFSAPWECLIECRLASGGFARADVLEMYLPAAWYRYHTLDEAAQADKLEDASKWLPTFWTDEMNARYQAVPAPENPS